MAITVSRPAGSVHTLRFTGSIALAAGAAGFGQYAGPTFTAGQQNVSFLMGLASTYVQPAGNTGVLDPRYRLPFSTYDDAVAGGPFASMPSRIWAQNTRVYCRALNADIIGWALASPEWAADVTTGLPVLTLTVTASGVSSEETDAVEIVVEVPHTFMR